MLDEVAKYRFSVRVFKIENIVLQFIQLGRIDVIKIKFETLFFTILPGIFFLDFDFFVDFPLFPLHSLETLCLFVFRRYHFVPVLEGQSLGLEHATRHLVAR